MALIRAKNYLNLDIISTSNKSSLGDARSAYSFVKEKFYLFK